jgi:hypothetical protein
MLSLPYGPPFLRRALLCITSYPYIGTPRPELEHRLAGLTAFTGPEGPSFLRFLAGTLYLGAIRAAVFGAISALGESWEVLWRFLQALRCKIRPKRNEGLALALERGFGLS